MDVSSENPLPSSKMKHRFHQWVTKWCHGFTEQATVKPDVASLVCLLQAIGCQLREFDKNDNVDDNIKQNLLKITIECGSSKMKALLELNDVTCQCQTKDDVKDASFWSISGTARMGSADSINKIEESGSNLLPQVSKDTRAMMHDVLYRLINTINSKGHIDLNRSSILDLSVDQSGGSQKSPNDKSESLTRSNTQPEIYRSSNFERVFSSPIQGGLNDRRISMSAHNISEVPLLTKTTATPERLKKLTVQRQKTWDLDLKSDVEPRPSPPKISSSPVILNELCSSLGHVSLQSDGDSSSKTIELIQCLKRIRIYIDRAINLYHNPVKPNDDLRPKSADMATNISSGSMDSKGSVTSSPARLIGIGTNVEKSSARRSISSGVISKHAATAKITPFRPQPRRKSMGGNSQPALQMAVASTQKTPTILKKSSAKQQMAASTSSSPRSSSQSRAAASAKRRVSPNTKTLSPLVKPTSSQLKTFTPKSLLNKSVGGAIGLGNSPGMQKLNTPVAKVPSSGVQRDSNIRKSVSPNPGTKKTPAIGGLSRLSVLRKEK